MRRIGRRHRRVVLLLRDLVFGDQGLEAFDIATVRVASAWRWR